MQRMQIKYLYIYKVGIVGDKKELILYLPMEDEKLHECVALFDFQYEISFIESHFSKKLEIEDLFSLNLIAKAASEVIIDDISCTLFEELYVEWSSDVWKINKLMKDKEYKIYNCESPSWVAYEYATEVGDFDEVPQRFRKYLDVNEYLEELEKEYAIIGYGFNQYLMVKR